MNVLFLDDNDFRCQTFRSFVPFGTIVNEAQECIDKLSEKDYDIVLLDHDLGGEVYVNSEEKNTGMEVVRWIVENKPRIGKVVVHSLNSGAALNMGDKLTSQEYVTYIIPFTSLVDWLKKHNGLGFLDQN